MSTIGLLEVLQAFAWVSRKQEVIYSLGPTTAGLLPNPAYNLIQLTICLDGWAAYP